MSRRFSLDDVIWKVRDLTEAELNSRGPAVLVSQSPTQRPRVLACGGEPISSGPARAYNTRQ